MNERKARNLPKDTAAATFRLNSKSGRPSREIFAIIEQRVEEKQLGNPTLFVSVLRPTRNHTVGEKLILGGGTAVIN